MKTKKQKKIVKTISLLVIFISFFLAFIYQHETIHRTIYHEFGINSTFGFSDLNPATFGNKTQLEDLAVEDPNAYNTMRYLQIEAEIIGYNFFPMYVLLLCFFFQVLIKR